MVPSEGLTNTPPKAVVVLSQSGAGHPHHGAHRWAAEAACAEAIAHSFHSADVVLNILARQRDPGPPATILTPAALTLHHAPIADCARYDDLTRRSRGSELSADRGSNLEAD